MPLDVALSPVVRAEPTEAVLVVALLVALLDTLLEALLADEAPMLLPPKSG